MSLRISHRGVDLTQAQLDVVTPVLNQLMRGEIKRRDFEAAVDRALEAAGLGVRAPAEVPHGG